MSRDVPGWVIGHKKDNKSNNAEMIMRLRMRRGRGGT